ncbi:hypothetical protein [Halosolutus halophilus]|uniref:hypothetical protein n=1 Tax=Halosolutus halophilus TaxID=1552990 RepID=UPI002234F6CB|nr:hypothetical protein [Halosolutus halophilus]
MGSIAIVTEDPTELIGDVGSAVPAHRSVFRWPRSKAHADHLATSPTMEIAGLRKGAFNR